MVSHGLINTREMKSAFAIELARRGFVVLAIDMSGPWLERRRVCAPIGYGGPDSLKYLRRVAICRRWKYRPRRPQPWRRSGAGCGGGAAGWLQGDGAGRLDHAVRRAGDGPWPGAA